MNSYGVNQHSKICQHYQSNSTIATMYTTPQLNSELTGNKILVSLTLNVTLQFEIELETKESEKLNQLNELNNQKKMSSDIVLSEISKAKLDEKIEAVLSNLGEYHNQEKQSITMMTKDISSTSLSNENQPRSNQHNANTINRRKVRLADSFNDSLTLTVNFVGTMLRLGKLANYSWE